ncbi:MAG: AMP-dependent synthetase and ligase [Gemmatimonadetes bacterium]|nr:AMP-dependent synthetase and ligase [Gemmatimonadota bacterium]
MTGALNLLAQLEAGAARAPGAVALVDTSGATITRAGLAARARAVAAGLMANGMQPGDHVLFAVRPSVAAVVYMVAIVEAGGVIVAADLGVGDAVFAAQVAASRPRWVVAESLLLGASRSGLVRRLARARGLSLLPAGSLSQARRVRVGRWLPGAGKALSERTLWLSGVQFPCAAMKADDEAPAIIVFTSGTTAAPRGVVHSRRSIAATLGIIARQLAIGEGDALYSRDVHLILPALVAGARVVVAPAGAFSPAHLLARITAHRVTHFFVVTAEAQALAEHLVARGERLPGTVREVMIGAAPVRVEFLRGFQHVLPPGARAWCVYGMTELLPAAWVTLQEKLAWTGEGDLVGRPAHGVTARLHQGELVLAGPNLFTGYLGGLPVTEHRTGDLAREDGDGRLVLRGRAKDMIIRGRYNIYPELHEPVLERIEGIRRCAMVGVWNEAAADERVVLVVERQPGVVDVELRARLATALRPGSGTIDDSALPDLVHFAALPTIGRSTKVDKQALRALAGEWLA